MSVKAVRRTLVKLTPDLVPGTIEVTVNVGGVKNEVGHLETIRKKTFLGFWDLRT